MKDSKVLIIGGTGFVGNALVKALEEQGFSDVAAVSRSSHGVDVTDLATLLPFVSTADYVINLAGYISFHKKDRDEVLKINNEGSINVLRACENNDVKKLVHMSSTASFGFGHDMVTEETEFDWDKPELKPLWQVTAKYGIPYFANFINSDMSPEDIRSMCCRIQLDMNSLRRRGGGLFSPAPLTGSIGVVTLNMPRLGYLSADESDFFERLGRLMEVARTSLETKRKS